ncbi:hypothetical protein [Absidia glauca]|uniref:Globin domain-containing protein n=1 Tax=Absidia glauca TaxID=4829 RepID=A0A163MXG7_ABSGL|nr:hypothetical protein [Absidia glauca]
MNTQPKTTSKKTKSQAKLSDNKKKPTELDPTLVPSQTDIDLVRSSWERVIETQHPSDEDGVSPAQAFGLVFYAALFHLDPHIRPLFDGTNVMIQAKMLTFVIGCLVRAPMVIQRRGPTLKEISTTPTGAEDMEGLAAKIRELGARHHFYNVEPAHFQLVGPAVDMALRERLKHEYTDAIGQAWLRTHAFVAHHMAMGLLAQRKWEKRKWFQRPASSGSHCSLQ